MGMMCYVWKEMSKIRSIEKKVTKQIYELQGKICKKKIAIEKD